jgi:alanine dehydrogenase
MIGGGNVGASASVFLLGANAEVRILDLYPDNPLKHFARMAANRFPSWFRRDHFGEIDVRKLTEAEVEEGLRWANGSHIITSNKSLDRPGSPADKVITDRHFSMLRFGTCIWDVSIDQGGATTKSHPTEHGEKTEAYIVGPDCYVYPDGEYDHPGVRMYCVDHIPGAFPETATLALTGATAPYIFDIATLGLADAIDKRPSLLGGINAAAGRLTLQSVTDKFGLGGLFTPVSELQLVQN